MRALPALACPLLVSVLLASPAPARDRGLESWRPLEAPGGAERAAALALGGGSLAAGGERGVALGPAQGPLRRVPLRGAVRALRFARGALWAAGDAGLWRIEAFEVRAEAPAPGERARNVHDLAAAAGWVLAATEAGVFASPEPGRWQRLAGLPGASATRVEASLDADGLEVWAAIGGSLWHRSGSGRVARVAAAGAASGEAGVIDLAFDGEGRLLVLRARSISLRDASGSWRSEQPALPPGAEARWLAVAAGRIWLATDAGLLWAEAPAGPWRRAAAPVGHSPVSALAGDGDTLVVATSQGLFRGAFEAVRALPSALPRSADPPIQAVHRAALRHLRLEPHRMHALARAAGLAAWLPEVRVDLDHEQGKGRAHDFDQAYISGDTRHLLDRDLSRYRDWGLSVQLEWDLGETVFAPDRIDVSREARLVAQLRDDVLDEIGQLYFERQRVLAALAAPPPDTTPALLRLRAAELAAGIDAWTGGWFSAQLAAPRR